MRLNRFTLPARRFATVAGLLCAVAVVVSACASGNGAAAPTVTKTVPAPSSSDAPSSSSAVKTTKPAVPTKPVHISSLESDGSQWGIGMPIILWFNVAPTSSVDFVKNTAVTVNGKPAGGAWFWQTSAHPGAKIEAHYRPRSFWPGHATIHVTFPPGGTSAGPGLSFDGQLTSLTMQTGPAIVGTVDGTTSKLTVVKDGTPVGVFPVALGAPETPTMNGTKVIMYKGRNERMVGSGYDEIVPWSMRLTNSGEYLHAAAWNIANVVAGRPSSNGCTNMLPADAQKLFGIMEIGDPVTYNNVPGDPSKVHTTPSWDGYGDWNLPWSTWSAGGLLRNH